MVKTASRVARLATLLVLGACAGLDVENPNNPDVTRALASGEDVKQIAVSNLNNWYLSSTWYYPYIAASVACDCHAANFGNFGMRFHNLEPRDPYINSTSAGDDRLVTSDAWENHYGTIGAANDVLKAFALGVKVTSGAGAAQVDETEKYKSLALFTQAASMSQLAMEFDSAFVVDENFDATAGAPTLARYDAVTTATMAKWDALFTQLTGRTDTHVTDATTLPLVGATLSSATIGRIGRTLAALTLRLTPRSRVELDAKPASYWQQIFTYANAGISGAGLTSFNVTVQGDNNNWWSYIAYYGAEASWMRADHRLINRMDQGPNAPVGFRYTGTADIKAPQNPATNDKRLGNGTTAGQDYRYAGNVIGDPARGIFMQSAYWHDRYVGHARSSATSARTAVPYILAAENDLLIAEAEVRRTGGDLARAATLINNTRVTRGGLAAVTAASGTAALLDAIDYERDVELLTTNGFGFYYARSAPGTTPLNGTGSTPAIPAGWGGGRIQVGTQRHWPLPARELEILGKAVYTYGGISKPDMVVIGSNGQEIGIARAKRPPRLNELFFTRQF